MLENAGMVVEFLACCCRNYLLILMSLWGPTYGGSSYCFTRTTLYQTSFQVSSASRLKVICGECCMISFVKTDCQRLS